MRWWLFTLILILLACMGGNVWAEDPTIEPEMVVAAVPAFTWSRMYLRWKWDSPADPAITRYFLECGRTPGVYTVNDFFAATVPEVAMKGFLPSAGTWYCRVTAMFGNIPGPQSIEYPFVSNAELILEGFVK